MLEFKKKNKAILREGGTDFTSAHKCDGPIVHCNGCNGAYSRMRFHLHKKSCTARKSPSFLNVSLLEDNEDEGFLQIMSSFHPDDPGNVCRSDKTIKFVRRKLWYKEKIKVNRTDEVRKTVMG